MNKKELQEELCSCIEQMNKIEKDIEIAGNKLDELSKIKITTKTSNFDIQIKAQCNYICALNVEFEKVRKNYRKVSDLLYKENKNE